MQRVAICVVLATIVAVAVAEARISDKSEEVSDKWHQEVRSMLSPEERAQQEGNNLEGCHKGYHCNCAQCKHEGYKYFCKEKSECYSFDWDCGLECSKPCEKTEACLDGCTDGFNCTCDECRADGFTFYCPSAKECYRSKPTCDISCGSGGCRDVQKACPAPNLTCSNSQAATCGNGTCCMNSDTYEPFCAAPNVTCCNYFNMTCPHGYACDPPKGTCEPPAPTPSTGCKVCEKIISALKSQDGPTACSDACGILPTPFSLLCDQIMNDGLCQYLIKKITGNFTAKHVCDDLGACGDTTCDCGYCMPDYYGAWCLSLPNHCPKGLEQEEVLADLRRYAAVSPPEGLSRHLVVAKDVGPFAKWRLPLRNGIKGLTKPMKMPTEFCVDGMCDKEHQGCCLTCAP